VSAILQTRGLTRTFGGLVAVADVDLGVEEGEIRALIGPNGAGKTTMINLLSGLLAPSGGRILWRSEDVTDWSAARRARAGIARTMQVTSVFPSLTVLENVWLASQRRLRFMPALTDRRRFADIDGRARQCVELVGLGERLDEHAGAIGHGDQRLLEIAIGLALEPRLLLLDEPTAGLSPKESGEIVGRLREIHARERMTIVIVEHDMDVVMGLADTVSVLHLGRTLAEGSRHEVAGNPEVQRVYLGGR
jgi:branched-chain amino acid transport system ATP-binding protein